MRARPSLARGPALVLPLSLAASAVLAGCAWPIDEPPPTAMHRFRATYDLEGLGPVVVELDSPVSILDRDGEHRRAIPLTIRTGTSPAAATVFNLDGDLRLVRLDYPCLNVVERTCVYASADWTGQGLLAPLGMGLPTLLSSDAQITIVFGSTIVHTTPTVHQTRRQTTVKVDVELTVTDPVLDPTGTYTFRPGRLLPDTIDAGVKGALTDYLNLGPLSLPEPWPRSADPAPPAPWTGRMFPGEEEDDYGVGYAHADAVDWLLSQSEEAAQMMNEGGCITSFTHRPPQKEPDGLLTMPQSWFTTTILDATGNAKEWTYTRQQTLIGGTFNMVKEERTEPESSCDIIRQSPWPMVSSSSFFALAERLQISANSPPRFFFSVHTFPSVPTTSTFGWHAYGMLYRPSFVREGGLVTSYLLYQVIYESNHGWFRYVNVHPEDLKALDTTL